MTTTTLDREAVVALAGTARRVILASHTPDSCIATTALVCDALRARGVACRPLAVGAFLFNERFVRCVEARGWPEGAQMATWQRDFGAYSVGIGYGLDPRRSDGRGWNGHLVAVVADAYLVDASLDQASRPAHAIVCDGPVALDLPPAVGTRRAPVVALTQGFVSYELRPDDHSFVVARDWRDADRRARAAALLDRVLAEGGSRCSS